MTLRHSQTVNRLSRIVNSSGYVITLAASLMLWWAIFYSVDFTLFGDRTLKGMRIVSPQLAIVQDQKKISSCDFGATSINTSAHSKEQKKTSFYSEPKKIDQVLTLESVSTTVQAGFKMVKIT